MVVTPAGWYPQEDGRQRYWDGQRWTEHYAPGATTAPPPIPAEPVPGGSSAAQPPSEATKAVRPWFKKKRFVIPGALVLVAILFSALGGGDNATEPASDAGAKATASSAASPSAAPETPAVPATKAPADDSPKIGSKVRDGKFEFVVTGMKCGIDQVGNEFLSADAQGEFCAITMTITNIGDEAQMMFADNQLAFDGDDRKFSADSEASIYDEDSEILFEEINPGNTVEGKVYFDVPKATELVRMELHDSAFSGGVEVRLAK